MKPVGVVEAYTIKKHWTENLEKLDVCWKMYGNESQKLLSGKFLFEVSSFSFHFAFALQYLNCYYERYTVKQTASLYLNLPLKPKFFSMFMLVLER